MGDEFIKPNQATAANQTLFDGSLDSVSGPDGFHLPFSVVVVIVTNRVFVWGRSKHTSCLLGLDGKLAVYVFV